MLAHQQQVTDEPMQLGCTHYLKVALWLSLNLLKTACNCSWLLTQPLGYHTSVWEN